MNGSILAIRSRTADTSAFTSRFWKPCSHRRQAAPLRLVALQHLYATTMKSGRTSRSANAPLQASTSLRLVPCQRDFQSRITRPKRRCARSGPTARSNGEATSSTFAALSLVKLSPSRKPRTDTGKCASSTCRSASSTRKHVSCVAAPPPRRTRSNHEQVSPIHPVRFVTHPSAGHIGGLRPPFLKRDADALHRLCEVRAGCGVSFYREAETPHPSAMLRI